MLGLHASVDDLSKVFLIFLFDNINFVPSLVFNLLPLLLILFNHILELLLKVFELFVFFFLLVFVLLLHLLALLFLPSALLGDHVFELFDLGKL